MSAYTDQKAARDNLAAIVKAKTDQWVADGCPPTISIDGESYDWPGWLDMMNRQILAMNQNIVAISSPWIIRSSGRG